MRARVYFGDSLRFPGDPGPRVAYVQEPANRCLRPINVVNGELRCCDHRLEFKGELHYVRIGYTDVDGGMDAIRAAVPAMDGLDTIVAAVHTAPDPVFDTQYEDELL